MPIRTSIYARVFSYDRDINGNRIARFAILNGDTLRELHVTKRRRQVGYGCEDDLDAVARFLETFEGGEWKRVSVLHQPSGEVLARYERDLEGVFNAASMAFTEATQTFLAAQDPGSKSAALTKLNEIHAGVHRLGVALNEAEAGAERRSV